MKNLFEAILGSRKLAVLAFCLCTFGIAQAQEYRVGYVDADRILTESAPAKAVEKQLENDFSKRLNDLRDTQARLKSMSEKLDKDLPVLSESQRLKRQRELADLSQDFQRKQRAYREDLMQRKNEEYSKVVDRAKKEIEKIAKSENYDLIVNESVYHSPRADITEKVLKALSN